VGFELPEESESFAMPAEQGLWLEDQQGLLPMREATGQKQELEAVGGGETRLLDLTVENDKLLAEQCIFCDQFGPTECESSGGAYEQGRASGLSEMTEGLIQE
jgi:hypothetical protein